MLSYAESIASRETRASTMRTALASPYSRPSLTIKLKDNGNGSVPTTFVTGDCIEGEVTISTQADIRFDDVCITFEGVYTVDPRLQRTRLLI